MKAMSDAERLEAFERVYAEILADKLRIEEELNALRQEGKQKTVKFRELLGRKMVVATMLSVFKAHGL